MRIIERKINVRTKFILFNLNAVAPKLRRSIIWGIPKNRYPFQLPPVTNVAPNINTYLDIMDNKSKNWSLNKFEIFLRNDKLPLKSPQKILLKFIF